MSTAAAELAVVCFYSTELNACEEGERASPESRILLLDSVYTPD